MFGSLISALARKDNAMFKWVRKLFSKEKPKVSQKHVYRRYQTDEEMEDEHAEMLILSDPSWFGDIARKHHG